MNIKIGNLNINNNVFLAPMAGITDKTFRAICREQGCPFAYTEMVSAKGLMYNNANTKELLDTGENERPVGVQIFGSDEKVLSDMAEKLSCGDYPIDLIDINMGCPANKIVKNGEGSALMKYPDKIGRIVDAVCKKSKLPVTIKIRKGFDNENPNAVEVAKIAERYGAKAITVHGRTREEYYSGHADLDIIAEVKENVSIPVIGNGDITDPKSAVKMLEYISCDGIMIGRGAQGNPWIFKNIIHYMETGEILIKPPIDEIISMALKHTEMVISHKGEYIGIREMRKNLGWYIKGIQGASEIRAKINDVKTYDGLLDIFKSILEKYEMDINA